MGDDEKIFALQYRQTWTVQHSSLNCLVGVIVKELDFVLYIVCLELLLISFHISEVFVANLLTFMYPSKHGQ